jgi:hypothetical protein
MAKKPKKEEQNPTNELLRDLLIVELGKAGVPQLEIRKILGCGIHRVSRIVKHLNKE